MKHKTNWSEARLPFRSGHLARVFQEFGDRDNFKLATRTLTRKVLDTSNNVSAIFCALDDHFDARFEFGGVAAVAQQQLGTPKNSGECVVDVVGHAKRELTERGHLLLLNILFALGFVLGMSVSDYL